MALHGEVRPWSHSKRRNRPLLPLLLPLPLLAELLLLAVALLSLGTAGVGVEIERLDMPKAIVGHQVLVPHFKAQPCRRRCLDSKFEALVEHRM